MKTIHRVTAAFVAALAVTTPVRAETVSLLCGGADRIDVDLKRIMMLETNGDQPVIVYSHVKITNDAFSGDVTLGGKKTALVIDRKSGQLKLTRAGAPPSQRACTPYAKAAPQPTNKF